MAVKIQIRNGTSSQWTAANPILAEGELAIESDTKKFKIGDGLTAWNSLLYATQGEAGPGLEFSWDGTQLGVRVEGEISYQYSDLKGSKGDKGDKGDKGIQGNSIEFIWDGTQLGVRIEGDTEYTYTNLKGDPSTVNNISADGEGNITINASDIPIADLDNRFKETNVEGALQEVYTHLEAVKKFAYLEEKTGNSVQITDTIDAPLAELEILGGVKITKQNPDEEVSPDNPQTFEFLQPSFDLFASGKNQIRAFNVPSTFSGVTMALDENKITLTGTQSYGSNTYHYFILYTANQKTVILKKGKRYRLSVQRLAGAVSTGTVSVFGQVRPASDPNGGQIVNAFSLKDITSETNRLSWDYTPPEDKIIFSLGFPVTSGTAITTKYEFEWQLEQGDDVTDWEPPMPSIISSPVQITLKDTAGNLLDELRGIPDVAQDRVFEDVDGKRYVEPNVAKIVVTGTENISITSQTTECISVKIISGTVPIQNTGTKLLVMANKFKGMTATELGMVTEGIANLYSASESGFSIRISPSRIVGGTPGSITVQQIKDLFTSWYVADDPLIIYGVARTVTPIELHPDTQADLNEIAKSFNGVTNIMLGSDVGEVKVKCAKNITKVIDDMKSAIALLG